MCLRKYMFRGLIAFGLLLCIQLPQSHADKYDEQPVLLSEYDGTLHFEAATDQNITFRLMGDSSTLLLNNTDIVAMLESRRRAALAQARETYREPITLDALKEQFRGVQRDLWRLSRWLNSRNGTRRNGISQRVLRRSFQRVQNVANILDRLELNLRRNYCRSNPCKNGGTCIRLLSSFQCICPAAWQGATCEDDVNECYDLASTDLAVCMNDAQCINTPGSYRCVCRTGYSGEHCRLRQNACLTNQSSELCGTHGTCLTANNAAGYVCICDQGWTWADTNATAASPSVCSRDVDECAPTVNPCHSECINLPGSFRCGPCPPGYTGDGKYCRDVNECQDGNNGGCSKRPTVNCINTEGSYRCGRCPIGWTGDGRTCTEAKSNSCNGEQICHPRAQCQYISETVVCSCPVGFFGHGYGADGCTEDSNRKPCDDHLCQNNGTCVLSGSGTSCICQPGYTGAICDKADACHPNPCANDGTCRLLPDNRYTCICTAGYSGSICNNLRSYCGAILRNETGVVQFPPSNDNNPLQYQPSERCAFIIRTGRGMTLNVTFGQFDLESSPDCNKDFLQIHDGSSLTARMIGRFCGNQRPLLNNSITSSQEQLFFWFRSDNETQGRGFNLTWTSRPMECGSDMLVQRSQTGILRSPGYPGKTRPGMDCHWHLKAPFGTRFLINFYEITLGEQFQSNCSTSDFLRIYYSDRELYRACSSSSPEPLYSSVNDLSIHFHTNAYSTDSSFQLHYEVIPDNPGCGGIYTEPRGIITSSMNSDICLYLIRQPPGLKIRLRFHKLNLMDSTDCTLQKLEIFDGDTVEKNLMGRFCGSPDEGEMEPLVSKENTMLIRYMYRLSGLNINKNFELIYERECRGEYTHSKEEDTGIIMTPKYPNPYIENLECSYTILGPASTSVMLQIKDLSLSDAGISNNSDSSLDVYLSRKTDDKEHFEKNLTNYHLVSEGNYVRLVFHGGSNPQLARGLKITYNFMQNKCGGVIRKDSDIFSGVVDGSGCEWIIESPRTKAISLIIRSLHDTAASLYIYDNSTTGEAKLLKYLQIDQSLKAYEVREHTDSKLLTIYIPPKMSMFLLIHVSYDTIEKACGGTSSFRYGSIKSPNWPDKYGSSEDCSWVIKAPLGERIELITNNFTMNDLCRDDFVEIRNGDSQNSPLIGRYCRDNPLPPRIPSFGNALYVHFQSDSHVESKGFNLNWQVTATGCGGTLNSFSGSIHSPHNIDDNRGALACDWVIKVSAGSTVSLELQKIDNLCNGQLILYDGATTSSPQLPMNCSSVEQKIRLQSSGDRVLVRYDVDDRSPNGLNFVLDYTTNCTVRLEQLQGAIETPNFPEPYPPNMNCEWDIRAGGGGNHIQLMFSHFELEVVDSNCAYDYVLIHDYRNNQRISETRLCSVSDKIFKSVGNRLVVKFQSDYSKQTQGFHAEYKREGCGEVIQYNGGAIATPSAPYSVDLDCLWNIRAPEGNQIRLILNELHIETPQRDCSQDSLTIWAGSNASDIILKSCRVEASGQTLVSPSNELNIRFQSSSQRARKYMKARYVFLPATCGTFLTATNGAIVFPNPYAQLPDIFDKNMVCDWRINLPKSYGINLDYRSFNLTDSNNCSSASLVLTVYNDDEKAVQQQTACGNKPPDLTTTLHRIMTISFKATAGSWGKFAIGYEQTCGGLRTDAEGYLRSQMDSNCYWKIEGSEGTKVSLSINQLVCLPSDKNNSTRGLRILNDADDVLHYNLCVEHPAHLIMPSNKVRIESLGIVLMAKYSTIVNSCGGDITSIRGTLSSPNYPDSYPANIECIWTFKPLAGNAIEFTFLDMDIAKSEQCNSDFLEIRNDTLMRLYCDDKKPDEVLVSDKPIWMKFRSQPGSTAKGFNLRWNYVHNIEIRDGSNGTIESPPKQGVQADEQPFTWRILMEQSVSILLDFEEYNTGLELYDGFDETALSVDIPSSPWHFISSSSVIFLRSVNNNFDEFRLKWRIRETDELSGNQSLTEGCSKIYELKGLASIAVHSPGYPDGYRPNLNCEWIFKAADATKHVYVDVHEALLEYTDGCTLDYLSIQSSTNLDNWQERLRLCNATAIPSGRLLYRVVGTPNLKLKFESDSSINKTGFIANVRSGCGSNLTESVGTIINYDLQRYKRSDSKFCEWHISVRPGRVIDLNIEYSGRPTNVTCDFYGLIYDGLDTGAQLMPKGKFCNQLGFNTENYRTNSSHATIRYYFPTRHYSSLPNNWTLTYREFRECNTELRLTQLASNYTITTPGYPSLPHAHSDCTWLVMAPPGETISATFDDAFDLSTRHCDDEFVELYDGATMLAPRMLHTCRKPSTLYSSGNLMLVHYQTELSEPHAGFSLNVSLSKCGGQHTTVSGVISSLHYPALGAYPKPAVCEYSIKARNNYHIEVKIVDLHVAYKENTDAANLDRLEFVDLTDGGEVLTVLYGNLSEMPYTTVFDTHEVGIRFVTRSTSSNSYRGFKLEYMNRGGSCVHAINAPSGDLKVLRKPAPVRWLRNCGWRITVPKGQRVRLELLNLEELRDAAIRNLRHHAAQNFKFYNDYTQISLITGINPRTYNGTAIITSTDNFMLVNMAISPSLSTVTIRGRFSSDEPSLCPPDIGLRASGTLTNQQLIQQPGYFCTINFRADEGVTTSFFIQDYSMRNGAFFRIRDDTPHNLINVFRSNTTISIPGTVGRVIFFQPRLAPNDHFRATYRRYACGGSVKLSKGDSIQLPQMNGVVGPIECVWRLTETMGYELWGNVSLSGNCDSESITIYNHLSGTMVKKICRDTTQLNRTLLNSVLYRMVYHANQYVAGNSEFRFEASLPAPADALNIMVQFTSKSPHKVIVDSSTYTNNLERSWEFQVESGMTLQLTFEGRFFIEMTANCSNDQLQVLAYKSELWEPIATYCGRDRPPSQLIQSHRIRLVFRTNANITAEGFTFIVTPSCDVKLEATEHLQSLSISSPRRFFVGSCNIEITSDSPLKMIAMVNIERRNCELFSFNAYRWAATEENANGEELIKKKLCNQFEVYGYRRLRLNALSLVYTGFRFKIEYQLIGCGGSFSSPFTLRYVQHKNDNEQTIATTKTEECAWHIVAPAQHAILLRFKHFQVSTTECQLQRLNVYRGSSQSTEERVVQMCSNQTRNTVMVDSNEAVVVAHPLDRETYIQRGMDFVADVVFTHDCNERLALSEGNTRMSLMRHYQLSGNNTEDLYCYFRASGTPSNRIHIWIKQLQLNNRTCRTCNTLELVDGFEIDSRSMDILKRISNNSTHLYSSTEDVLIKLYGYHGSGSLSFEIMLEMMPSVCGQLEYNLRANESINFRLNSTNLTAIDRGNIHCIWHINTDDIDDVVIQMKEVRLPDVSPRTRKCQNYLMIQNELSQNSKYFCGRFHNATHELAMVKSFNLVFHSIGTYWPFYLDITVKLKSQCNRTFTAMNDILRFSTPHSPAIESCSNEIRVPEGNSIALEIESVNFQFGIHKARVEVIDLIANRTIYNVSDVYNIYTESVQSTSNALRINLIDVQYAHIYYRANRNNLPSGCGGELTQLEGMISNPDYQNHTFSLCSWQISVPAGESIIFSFREFNMGPESNCQLDNIQFFEVRGYNTEILRHNFCGSTIPDEFRMTANRLKIVAKKSPNFSGTGFRLYYIHGSS